MVTGGVSSTSSTTSRTWGESEQSLSSVTRYNSLIVNVTDDLQILRHLDLVSIISSLFSTHISILITSADLKLL